MKIKILVQRCTPKYKFIYIISALFLVLLGVMKSYMGAHFILFPIAILCLSMTLYPILLIWLVIVVLFMIVSVEFSTILIQQLIAIRSDIKIAYILEDYPIDFPLMVFFIIVLTISIIIAKPKIIKS